MKIRLAANLSTLALLSLASIVSAQQNSHMSINANDPLADALFEIISVNDEPIGEFPRLTRLRVKETALVFHDLSVPMATGLDGFTLGVAFDPTLFVPRPAIECIGEHPVTNEIGLALARADRISQGATADMFLVLSGEETIMTL
ncbi:hypothetical protein Q4555_06155 [Octadecabacter sp. 1_MG-2023]|uniref:hypothetical protein n=1 Tax=unclassified Octadecabacter TaxID=196158 RepID=UPI001C096798|nr:MULTISPECIES: hypothetical protein [unclassified Octadecabacter]MBU2994467.1 hypothetical protein [Octadecabacter sp. B2R22]MDO6734242.1 hypothetical protein [Octadecabacter sp. 1_MG-2023]